MNAIAKVNYTHDAVIDLIIANPSISQGELAKRFGYTQGWLSQVIKSDAFRERVAARKNELVDPVILQSIEETFRGLVGQSLEILSKHLEAAPTFEKALKAADLGSRALGYGAKAANVNLQQNNFVVHTPPKAKDAQEWLDGRVVNG